MKERWREVDNAVRRVSEPVEQSDSARYRQMGNAVAVPVAEWIMKRLVEVDDE
jgi:site-specific DNA-cytosine methylase